MAGAREAEIDYSAVRRNRLILLVILGLALFGSALVSILVGTSGPIGPGNPDYIGYREAFGGIVGTNHNVTIHSIFWHVRIPRVVLAGLVGAALACAGTAMQAVFRNPMADPFIVGVSTGASLGAVAATTAGIASVAIIGSMVTPALAFSTALVTVLVVYRLGVVRGKVYVDTLLLSGVAMAAFLGAVVSFMIYFTSRQYQNILFWLLGSFALSSWPAVAVLVVAVSIGTIVVFIFSRDLNALLLGEETAHNLGANPEFLKTIMLIMAAVMTAAAVAFAGVIGFVGLIIPHMVRIIVGADHRILVPAATLTGAVFLIWADTLARTVIAPTELPVGIVTAMCGGPFFLYLLRRNKAGGGGR